MKVRLIMQTILLIVTLLVILLAPRAIADAAEGEK